MPSDAVVHIIDDDAGARDALAFLLDCSDIPTRTYESARQFLDAVPGMEQGCIITDVRMPEMTGLELVERLKSAAITTPVIMITGHADVPMAIQAMHAGVTDFIEKPFSDEAILGAVRSALARQQDRDELQVERDAIRERLATLSGREGEVMEGLVDGKANKVIAYDLSISARTVEVYRANVMTKMQARTLSELVRMVMIARLA
ncbi:response regulator FixJ [Novosphingobium malaysiense]|uniref:Response regulator FixJ n=1 Tax=Novosphingobium malaysiense TaxID=1348853 RepID=A0A0B1ZIC3_9SPHN|nr:response regulator FixJ [Novosphingobium malaysiense]KHK89028.1 response regulator FixJ [Novosphingobium malaysiense]